MARRKNAHAEEAELEMTPYISLLIVLVPVLLMQMQIGATSLLDIKLPGGGGAPGAAGENQQIEVIIHKDYMTLNYPAGVFMDKFPQKDGKYDFQGLNTKLQQLKPAIESSIGKPKKDILILSEDKTDYQTLVSTMDAVKSYKAVVVTDAVDVELFPEVSLGDAPVLAEDTQ